MSKCNIVGNPMSRLNLVLSLFVVVHDEQVASHYGKVCQCGSTFLYAISVP